MEKERRAILTRTCIIRAGMVLFDILAVNAAYPLALLIRYYVQNEFLELARRHLTACLTFAPYYTVACLIVFAVMKLYSGIWKYAGLNDLNRIVQANLITAVIQVVGTLVFLHQMPKSYYAGGALIQFFLIGGSRFAYRIFSSEKRKVRKGRNQASFNVMIAGIGETGSMIRNRIEADHANAANPVCVFSFREESGKGMVDGIPLVSGMANLKTAIEKYRVECVILADSVMPEKIRQEIRSMCREKNVGVQDFSGYFQNEGGSLSFKQLMECAQGAVEITLDGKEWKFASGEEALMALTESYDVETVCAKADRLSILLSRHKVILNNTDEKWVREFENETGESISFF